MTDKFRFFVTCAHGTEGPLRKELAAMRIAGAKGDRGGVWFEGPLAMGMSVCLHARVAVRVLMQLTTFEARDQQELYDGARAVPWRDWLTATSTFAVHAEVHDTPSLSHSGFAALKVKDAVADALRDALGRGPTSIPSRPRWRSCCGWQRGRGLSSSTWPARRCTGAGTGWRWSRRP